MIKSIFMWLFLSVIENLIGFLIYLPIMLIAELIKLFANLIESLVDTVREWAKKSKLKIVISYIEKQNWNKKFSLYVNDSIPTFKLDGTDIKYTSRNPIIIVWEMFKDKEKINDSISENLKDEISGGMGIQYETSSIAHLKNQSKQGE